MVSAGGDSQAAVAPLPALDPRYDRAFRQLCHVVAITRTGTEAEAVENLVTTTIVLDAAAGSTSPAIAAAISGYFGINLAQRRVGEAVDNLVAKGRLLRRDDGQLVVAPEARRDVEQRSAAASALERAVRDQWLEGLGVALAHRGTKGETLWTALQQLMARAFRRHGAETVLLLDPLVASSNLDGSLSGDMAAAVSLAHEVEPDASRARDAFRSFFRTTTPERNRYIAQLLDGTFSFFALSSDEATSQYLRESLPQLKIFLDTNFIFGLIGLNDDDLNSVATELLEFINANRFPFILYYHEKTLAEIERTLDAIGHRLTSQRWTRAASSTAVQAGTLSAVELRYHRLNAEQGMDADAFLARYRHVRVLLDEAGVRIYREPGEAEGDERRRWLLIAEYNDYKRLMRPDRTPRYEALDHDVSVWTSVERLRVAARSALHSGAIFLSADRLLFRFDWDVKRDRTFSGSVVLPAQLLQVLRPFVTVDLDFDKRFVETFALPEFRTATTNYGPTASKVLSYLTTLKDLPQRTAVAVLQNELLLRRLRDVPESSDEFRTEVRSAVIDANQKLVAENAALRTRLEAAEALRGMPEPPADLAESSPSGDLDLLSRPGHPDIDGVAVTARSSALVVVVVFVALAVFLAIGVTVGTPPSDSAQAALARLYRAGLGSGGILVSAYALLVFRLGVMRGSANYMLAALRHTYFRWAFVTAIGAGGLLFWGLQ